MKKSLKRITLHNFQSHEDTSLDLSSGVNVIVGPSDVGKTSVIRALRWLYYNQPRGSSFIRMGTSDCWVEVETEDDIIVRRYRNEAARKNGYLLLLPGQEPLVYERHGTAVPEEIKLALGVEEIVIDQDVIMNLNLAYQLEGAFLLETPGTTRAKAIGRLGDAHIVDAAQREIQKDLRAVGQEIEQKKKQLIEEEKALSAFTYLDDWKLAINKLNDLFAQRQAQELLQNQLVQLLNRYGKARQQLNAISPYLQGLKEIDNADQCREKLQSDYQLMNRLESFKQQYSLKSQDYLLCGQILEQTVILPAVQEIVNRIEGRDAAVRVYEELQKKYVSTRQKLEKVNHSIAATEHLEDAGDKLYKMINNQTAVTSMSQVHRNLTDKKQGLYKARQQLAATEDINQVETILDRLILLRESGIDAQNIWRELNQRQDKLEQVRTILTSLDQCSTAEEELNQVTILQQQKRLMEEYQAKCIDLQLTLKQHQQRLLDLASGYKQDTEQYLDCLAQIGQCPVCHGNIDERHLQELKLQLEVEWENE